MKEYSELSQLFEQHCRPEDYRAFAEKPEMQPLKTHFGPELTCIFLCLLSQRFLMDEECYKRLLRYKKENRLRDFEAAVLELVALGFVINATLIHHMCNKTESYISFLPSVQMLNIAKQAGLLNALNSRVASLLDSPRHRLIATMNTRLLA